MKYIAYVDQITGKVNIPNRHIMNSEMNAYRGKTIEIDIKVVEYKHKSTWRAYYFGILIPFIQKLYYNEGMDSSTNTIHRDLKKYCLRHKIVDPYEKEPSIADLSNQEFAEYVDRIYIHVLEFFNTEIPDNRDTSDNDNENQVKQINK